MALGRPPVPNEIKERRGTLRPDRLPSRSTTILAPSGCSVPAAPRGLSRQAKRVWVHIWTLGSQWLADDDAPLVEAACRTHDDITRLRKALIKYGDIVEEVHASASGKVLGVKLAANPASKLLRDAETSWRKYLVLLAIPPTERARLGLTQVKAQSKLEALAASRQRSAVEAVPDTKGS